MALAPIAKTQRTTYRVHVKDVAEALKIDVPLRHWVTLEDGTNDDTTTITDYVDIVIWGRL